MTDRPAPGPRREGAPGEARSAATLVAVAALALLGAAAVGYFRAEDWLGLEIGARALTEWRSVITTLWYDGFYRPVTDLYVAVMVRFAPREPWPHFAALILLFGLETWLLARIARMRGADTTAAWLVAGAAWAQVNTYVWSTLWMSNAGGNLATGFLLAAVWLHHRGVAGIGRAGRARVGLAAATALALLSKEDAVLLPGILVALEAPRWSRLSPEERRRSLAGALVVTALVAVYVVFRLTVMPTPQVPGQHYQLRFGGNWVLNLSKFVLHLGVLPLVALVLARLCYPAAWTRPARDDPSWTRARQEFVAGLAWAGVAIQIFLPIGGFAYGYLHGPMMGIALGVGSGLAWVARVPSVPAGRRVPPALLLGLHWALAAVAVAWVFTHAGWPRYRVLAREAFATLDRAMPAPPESALVVFLDPQRSETITGRSYFNMMFDGMTGSALRVHYRRPDLRARYVPRAAAEAAGDHPEADLIVIAERGRLRVVHAGPRVTGSFGDRGP